ncbi:ABC-three component system protein [Streptomyces sp. LS1784]|uniref:ABC-three component system protein n=1 Tax=Streptomyces sp. LS1784 TaxID=2851533 RepID=UPI001CCE7829|nr:ABC-three component system protein [Streptomyces sp. LS1784]
MTADGGEQYEASASALGYLFQFAKALHMCFEQWMSAGPDWSIAVEAADDIEQHVGSVTDLLQLKQRAEGVRLTDTSKDLWKTLRIWAEAATAGRIDLDETNLYLLTTAELPVGSVGYLLQHRDTGHRDEERALKQLCAAAGASKTKSQDLLKSFAALTGIAKSLQSALLARVQIVGDTEDIADVRTAMLRLAAVAAGHDAARAFLNRLEGWFYDRVIEQMRTPGGSPITGVEFDEVFSSLQRQFQHDNLPIDGDITLMTGDPTEQAEKIFVRQLGLIGVSSTRIRFAVRDYVRAFAQRSRWTNENLLRPGEIGEYERRLVEEWEARFAVMEEELGAEATEEQKKAEAKLIYRWVDQEARFQIRAGCDEVFVTKGSYQMLADECRVGWHPDFAARLMQLLEPVEVPG